MWLCFLLLAELVVLLHYSSQNLFPMLRFSFAVDVPWMYQNSAYIFRPGSTV